jgi:hypothetical protein
MKVRARAEGPAPVYRPATLPRLSSVFVCSRRRKSGSRNRCHTPTLGTSEGGKGGGVRIRPRAEPGTWTYSSHEGTTASTAARRSTHSVRRMSGSDRQHPGRRDERQGQVDQLPAGLRRRAPGNIFGDIPEEEAARVEAAWQQPLPRAPLLIGFRPRRTRLLTRDRYVRTRPFAERRALLEYGPATAGIA